MNYEHADYLDTDDRGRVTLGNEFANSNVAVAWAEMPNPDPEELSEPSDAEKEILGDLYQWGRDNGYSPIDFDPYNGRIYTKDAEWIDTDVTGLKEVQGDE